jgi:ankyrin repeat protein
MNLAFISLFLNSNLNRIDYMNFYSLLNEYLINQPGIYGRWFDHLYISGEDLRLDFYCLAKEGHTELIREMINTSTVEITQKSLTKALMVAVKNNQLQTMKYLLSIKADINYSNSKNRTSLFIAVANNNFEMVCEILNTNNCDVFHKDYRGNTILMYAVKETASIPIIDRLQKLPNAQWLQITTNQIGHFPLYSAKEDIANSLIQHKAPINQITIDGVSSILIAVRQKNKGVAKILIDAGCQVNHKTTSGETPLLRAIQNDWVWGVKSLLDAGALIDFNSSFDRRMTQNWRIYRLLDMRPEEEQEADKLEIKKLLALKARQIKKERTYILLMGQKDLNSNLRVLPTDMIKEICQYI